MAVLPAAAARATVAAVGQWSAQEFVALLLSVVLVGRCCLYWAQALDVPDFVDSFFFKPDGGSDGLGTPLLTRLSPPVHGVCEGALV